MALALIQPADGRSDWSPTDQGQAQDLIVPGNPIVLRSFTKKSRRGKPGGLKVKECYLRNDIPCYSRACGLCQSPPSGSQNLLAADADAYVVLDDVSLLCYLDILEMPELRCQDVILLQSVLDNALHLATQKEASRLHNLFDPTKGSRLRNVIVFPNQYSQETSSVTLPPSEVSKEEELTLKPFKVGATKNTAVLVKTCLWFWQHLQCQGIQIPVIVVSDAKAIRTRLEEEGGKGVECLSFMQFVDRWGSTGLASLCEDLKHAFETRVNDGQEDPSAVYTAHLNPAVLKREHEEGRIFRAKLKISSHNAWEGTGLLQGKNPGTSLEEVYLYGRKCINRAIHGDIVGIRLLPKEDWLSPPSAVKLIHEAVDEDEAASTQSASVRVPTGVVVGIFSRSLHHVVATLPSKDLGTGTTGDEYLLAVPMDIRIPKIRIRTRKGNLLAGKRITVALDTWPLDSLYPHGHYIRTIGSPGVLETEVEALLEEYSVVAAPFGEGALACLPPVKVDPDFTKESDNTAQGTGEGEHSNKRRRLSNWTPSSTDLDGRRDIRSTHRVFSVDPPGCQDIDDAMSVRALADGAIELGVHIADVTHFVQHKSPLDMEARFDMLPSLLSSDICSLLGGRERLAVSVFWELDPITFRPRPGKTWFGRTVIHSVAAMTYDQANRLLQGRPADLPGSREVPDGEAGGRVNEGLHEPLRKDLRLLTAIAHAVRDRRLRNGAVELSQGDELKFELTANGEPVYLSSKGHLEVHDVIAELMIMANSSVAKKIIPSYNVGFQPGSADKFPSGSVLRRHLAPSPDRLKSLEEVAKSRGLALRSSSNKDLQALLDEVRRTCDKETTSLVKSLTTRAMQEAEYYCFKGSGEDKENEMDFSFRGHYGLGLDFYTHFTSPIRRYPDIIVHRMLLSPELERSRTTAESVQPTHPSRLRLPLSLTPSILTLGLGVAKSDPNFAADNISKVFVQTQERRDFDDDDALLDELLASSPITSASPPQKPSLGKKNTLGFEGLHSTVVEGHTEERQKEYKVDAQFASRELSDLCEHMNERHRSAKLVSKACEELFLTLFLRNNPQVEPAIITSVKSNGVIAYVPKFDFRGPVYVRDKYGDIQIDPALLGLDTQDFPSATSGFEAHPRIKRLPGATLTLKEDERLLILAHKDAPRPMTLRVFDRILLQLSCDFSTAMARLPTIRCHLVGVGQGTTKHGSTVEGEKFNVYKGIRNALTLQNWQEEAASSRHPISAFNTGTLVRPMSAYFACPPQKHDGRSGGTTSMRVALDAARAKSAESNGIRSKEPKPKSIQVNASGTRISFGGFRTPNPTQWRRSKYQELDRMNSDAIDYGASDGLLVSSTSSSRTSQALSQASNPDAMRRLEREAVRRTEKLLAAKRHDKINKKLRQK